MSSLNDGELRPAARSELRLLIVLLAAEFPGREALVQQASHMLVSSIDENGSLRLDPPGGLAAIVERRIPVEAEIEDEDGVTVHILLHVREGKLDELEIFREDSGPLRRRIDTDAVRVIIF